MKKHHSALKRLDAQLSPGTGSGSVGSSKLDREWEADKENLRLRLQKHREEAVSRYLRLQQAPTVPRQASCLRIIFFRAVVINPLHVPL